jgi:hypothetical protein
MSWQEQLKGDPISWLLETDAPGVRYLAMRHLLDLPTDNPELLEARHAAHHQGPIHNVLAEMAPEGYWVQPGSGYNPKYRSTVWSMILLAQLGASMDEDARIATACNYMLENTLAAGGQFSASSSASGTADCLQGNLCWSLLELGCTDPHLDTAFDWMARSVTGEGIAPSNDRHAAVRYYAGKCGPTFACGSNDRSPCGWGAAKVMLAFGKIPAKKRTPAIERAIQTGIDFLFSVDLITAAWPCGYADKPSGNWWKFGFPVFYITDLLQVAEALAALGCGRDPRMRGLLDLILSKQVANGRWLMEYDYTGKTWVDFGSKKEPNKWVTLRALKVLIQALE